MPCFKGLAVSIHAPDGAISEYSIQKQSRASRISSYIPVPPAKIPTGSSSGKPEQSSFAISITLLTPGQNVPYSAAEPTLDDLFPKPRVVGGMPRFGGRGKYNPAIQPYIPRTTNPNETVAAYIYFDGRVKEEVATLLRRGEETWVNSRWVSVPDSEGGGLAEREFLFREVGLERWLNGLDLEGNKDKAERIERRQKRIEKKRRKKKGQMSAGGEAEEADSDRGASQNGVLRYGGDANSPVEDVGQDDGFFSTDSDSDDEPPQPEAAGQIKIVLFRVLASGDIKRGEYSPQFGAHDDDEANGTTNGDEDGDIDHTTSFAKPKALDPKSISTQTVTGLDPPESPYAVFTFFYRGKKQLQKMGILPTTEPEKTPLTTKKKSTGPDFSHLGPLQSSGTVGFSGYRDSSTTKRKGKPRDADAMDSDADDEDDNKLPNGTDEVEEKQVDDKLLSPEDVKRQGEIADGVQKIQLKRQHSAEPLTEPVSARKSPYLKTEDSPPGGTPQSINSTSANAGTPPEGMSPKQNPPPDPIGSPFKRQRASLPGLAGSLNSGIFGPIGSNTDNVYPPDPSIAAEESKTATQSRAASVPEAKLEVKMDEDEEL